LAALVATAKANPQWPGRIARFASPPIETQTIEAPALPKTGPAVTIEPNVVIIESWPVAEPRPKPDDIVVAPPIFAERNLGANTSNRPAFDTDRMGLTKPPARVAAQPGQPQSRQPQSRPPVEQVARRDPPPQSRPIRADPPALASKSWINEAFASGN